MLQSICQNPQLVETVLHTVDSLVIVLDKDGIVRAMNAAAVAFTHYDPEEVVGRYHWSDFVPAKEQDKVERLFKSLLKKRTVQNVEHHWLTKEGNPLLVKWHNTVITDEHDEIEYVIATGVNITDQARLAEELKISSKVVETGDPVLITDAALRIIKVNEAFTRVTGYSEADVLGQTPRILSSGAHDQTFYENMWQSLQTSGCWAGEITNRHKSGHYFTEYMRISTLHDNEGQVTHYVSSFIDISAAKANEQKLRFLARFDSQTGIANRDYFTRKLDQTIQSHQQNRQKGLLFYLRLGFLEKMEAHYGNAFVDTVILKVLHDVEHTLAGYQYFLGRITGSGFGICILNVPRTAGLKTATQIARSVVELTRHYPLAIDEEDEFFNLYPEIGICTFPDAYDASSLDAEAMLHHALIASQKSRDKKECYEFYSSALQRAVDESHKLEVALNHAIQKLDEFELHHQPQFDACGRVTGGEALIRWKHNGKLVSPGLFIPLAEKTDDIITINRWVFKQAVAQLHALDEGGLLTQYRSLSVNFSPKCIMAADLVTFLQNEIERTPWVAQRIKLEVTESSFIHDIDAFKQRLAEIKTLGFKVSIDDFGTGYSSLSYLTELEFDEIKIDQSFVSKLNQRCEKSCRVIKSIISIAKALNVNVVAEGVETAIQLEVLKELQCAHFQGFLFSKPLPVNELTTLLARNPPSTLVPASAA
ncbi:sensor domain-containing protein [Thiomicrorhabdus cannonii]|uniref:sensor domain-containing protein n=1 Tax=Thiomicrorhabdus cannonii TaxID=2748011 RepID=UPI0015B942F7|nr:EAL domain-containing protein [Thiomicrorhabdus cannonii]